jgi:probable phosphoglycerate mutase
MTREYHQTVYAPPPGAADILLIRHGQSAGARPGESFPMKDGHGDPELHPTGHEQAQAGARRFADAPIAAVYVTTLQRTHQTAAPLVDKLRLTPTVEADLREICLGDWDGGEYRIRAANNDPIWQRAKALREWGELPGAETTAALHERVRRGLLRIAANHPDQLVAAFVHGGVIGAAMALASGSDPFAFHGAANGSVSRLVIQGETMTIRGFNDCAHL